MRLFYVPPTLEPRVGCQRITLGNPDSRLARNSILPSGDRYKRPPFQRRSFREGHFRHLARLAGQWKILSQREIRVPFPHQNSAQVRMAAETNPHHVVNLPLMPISRSPHTGNAWRLAFFLAYLSLKSEVLSVIIAAEMVNQDKTRV